MLGLMIDVVYHYQTCVMMLLFYTVFFINIVDKRLYL